MSDSPNPTQFQALFSKAWNDADFKARLMSGNQDEVKKCWADVGVTLDDDVTMHMVDSASKGDRYQVIPPADWSNDKDGAAGKCYGPLCAILTGPF